MHAPTDDETKDGGDAIHVAGASDVDVVVERVNHAGHARSDGHSESNGCAPIETIAVIVDATWAVQLGDRVATLLDEEIIGREHGGDRSQDNSVLYEQ